MEGSQGAATGTSTTDMMRCSWRLPSVNIGEQLRETQVCKIHIQGWGFTSTGVQLQPLSPWSSAFLDAIYQIVQIIQYEVWSFIQWEELSDLVFRPLWMRYTRSSRLFSMKCGLSYNGRNFLTLFLTFHVPLMSYHTASPI